MLIGCALFSVFAGWFLVGKFSENPCIFCAKCVRSEEVRCSVFVNAQNTEGPNVFGERLRTRGPPVFVSAQASDDTTKGKSSTLRFHFAAVKRQSVSTHGDEF
jgi:hypothetical protein